MFNAISRVMLDLMLKTKLETKLKLDFEIIGQISRDYNVASTV